MSQLKSSENERMHSCILSRLGSSISKSFLHTSQRYAKSSAIRANSFALSTVLILAIVFIIFSFSFNVWNISF
nr:MAG TPA: hypothetical protein [Caudoviricetes sp.]